MCRIPVSEENRRRKKESPPRIPICKAEILFSAFLSAFYFCLCIIFLFILFVLTLFFFRSRTVNQSVFEKCSNASS